MNKYIVLDIETTGFSHETCDIIQICAWKVEDGVVVDKFDTYVRPHFYVPRTIQNLTGITNEMLVDYEPIEVVLPEFFEFCGDYSFVGHNLSFDYNFIKAKGKNLGLDFTLSNTRTGICTMKLAKKYLSLESNKLVNVAEHLGVSMEGVRPHNASSDVYMTKAIYDRFLYNYSNLADVKIPELLYMQDKTYGRVDNEKELPL